LVFMEEILIRCVLKVSWRVQYKMVWRMSRAAARAPS